MLRKLYFLFACLKKNMTNHHGTLKLNLWLIKLFQVLLSFCFFIYHIFESTPTLTKKACMHVYIYIYIYIYIKLWPRERERKNNKIKCGCLIKDFLFLFWTIASLEILYLISKLFN